MGDNLPSNWVSVPLAEVVLVTKGRRADDLGPMTETRTVPYINIAAFESGIAAQHAPEQGLRKVMGDDTLLVWDGARAGLAGRSVQPGYAASTLAVVSPILIDPDYLHRFLESQFETINSTAKGAGVPHVDPDVFNNLCFPLAPLDDQKEVVRRLNQVLEHLRIAKTETEGARRDAGRAWTASLAAAMRGDLTARWREETPVDEDGDALLSRTLASRPEADSAGSTEGLELPELPVTWSQSSMGSCFDIVVGGTPNRRQPQFWGGTIPWVSSGEVQFNRIAVTRETLTEAGLAHSSARLNPPGSVLIGMIGQGRTRGQVAILDVEAATNQNCAAIRVSETDIIPEFVFYWLWSRYDATRETSVGNNQPALNRSLIAAMPLPVPPREEMGLIVELLDGARAQNEQLEKSAERILADIGRQREMVFDAAFSGKLVAPAPDTEPAGALRERIREARLARKASARNVRPVRRARKMNESIEKILQSEGEWISAPDLFRRCGVVDESSTDMVEARYRELMALEREGRLETQPVLDSEGRKITDRLRLRSIDAA